MICSEERKLESRPKKNHGGNGGWLVRKCLQSRQETRYEGESSNANFTPSLWFEPRLS